MITLRSAALTARIDPYGAELHSLLDADGRELMTDADPRFWTGRAPILFPIVGGLAGDTLRVDGRAYAMAKHGFARRSDFAVDQPGEDRAVFTLRDDAATRASYPFAFRLEVAFGLAEATLSVEVAIHNPDPARDLPASFGFHPAFAWPLPYGQARADHRIVFAHAEPEPLRALAADGTVLAATRPSPLADRTLPLADALFEADALIWSPVRSQAVRYGADEGPQLEVAFPDTPSLGVWTKPGAHFICIEPWHGHADPQGYAGEFRDKPGVFAVAPGATKRIAMAVTLLA